MVVCLIVIDNECHGEYLESATNELDTVNDNGLSHNISNVCYTTSYMVFANNNRLSPIKGLCGNLM